MKNNRLSGIGPFIILVSLFIAAACSKSKEEPVVVPVENASVSLNVMVVSEAPGFVAPTPVYSPSQTITGNPTITKGQPISATATYNGSTVSFVTETPYVPAGCHIDLNGIITIPYNAGGYTTVLEESQIEETVVLRMLQAAAAGENLPTAEVQFDGETFTVPMLENAGEDILTDSFTYTSYSGARARGYEVLNDDFRSSVQLWYKNLDTSLIKTEQMVHFSVSAWSLYNVLSTTRVITTMYNVVAIPDDGRNYPDLANPVVGYIFVDQIAVSWAVCELPHPDYADNYNPGHGHGVIQGTNAGGGLVEAE